MEKADIPAVVGLQRACFPEPFPEDLLWQESHLQAHLSRFHEGQFVIESSGIVAASSSSLIISESNWTAHLPWEETVGGFMFSNHHPSGTTLYGADISVHPDYRRLGLGRRLYLARFDLVTQLGLARYGTACRLPDASKFVEQHGGDIRGYVAAVERGETVDRTLSPLLRYGLRLSAVIEDYMDDAESLDSAAVLEWTPTTA